MSDKLKMHTPNKADENFAKLAALFPNAVTETKDEHGDIVRAIDKDILMQEISATVVDGADERYQFTWPDKKKSILLANAPINKTLRPYKEESVNFDTTENLYIEGDNLEVLKLLQETYLGKIKMIYIDPPYNTGNDFVYEDDFTQAATEYISMSGQYNDEGNRLVQNFESNGRYHTDWLNMIYPRLKISKDLLSDDGVIIISIDDHEVDNLKKVCDEIFGQSNFIGLTVRVSSPTQNIAKFMSIMHDYSLIYCKNKEANGGDWRVPKNNVAEFESRANKLFKSGASQEEIAAELRALVKYPRFYDFDHYYFCDDGGIFRAGPIGGVQSGNVTTQILHPITKKPCKMPKGGWRYKDSEIQRLVDENKLLFGKDETIVPQTKLYLHDYLMQIPKGINFFDTQTDVHFLSDNGLPFDFPKPVDYIEYLEAMIVDENSIVLDFFSGSATTAHATMKMNAKDDGNRKYIMVQLPEEIGKSSANNNSEYKTICEVGKERIRRAAKKIAEENPDAKFDSGFRVLKCDTSNMKDVYYNPSEFEPSFLDTMEDNIKEDRTPEDLLFQVMLDLGVLLSSEIEETTIAGKKVFNVADNFLIACFDKDVNDEVIKEIAQKKPYYFVMRDSSMANDSVATNFEQIFATFSPDTVRKVL
ncbi:MAG: site-specific DNA-methyltransferase [Ruminococcaceae bacterium]|nr:site-specific DNA-methyltransferase [Oscillospiraceae bacterium]